jgi:chemotaxis protein MotA
MAMQGLEKQIGRLRIDYTAPVGLVVGLGGIVLGLVLEGGRLAEVAQITAAVIVFGGTLGAVILTTPASMLKSAARRLRHVLFEEDAPLQPIIEVIVDLATRARKNGIVSLEQEIVQVQYPLLNRGLMLAVDGTATNEMRELLELEIKLDIADAELDAKVFEAAGGYAPTIGIVGAVIGLIQVMKHLDNLSQVGAGIAVAFVATIYGVGSANLVFLPLGQKIRLRAQKSMRIKQLMLEGVMSISQGINPRLIRRKLETFQRSDERFRRPAARLEATPRKAVSA